MYRIKFCLGKAVSQEHAFEDLERRGLLAGDDEALVGGDWLVLLALLGRADHQRQPENDGELGGAGLAVVL